MSEGLRAEDVKEALARASKGTVWYTDEEPWPTIVAAARDHLQCLASQATTEGRYVEPTGSSEQTPDLLPGALTSPTIERIAQAIYDSDLPSASYDRRGRMTTWDRLPSAHRRPFRKAAKSVLAALVGFHPQDEGDER